MAPSAASPTPAPQVRGAGIWAPGVSLFRRLPFLAKVGLICGVFALVIAQLGFYYLRANQGATSQTLRALEGLAELRALLPVIDQAQALRQRALLEPDAAAAALKAADEQLAAFERRPDPSFGLREAKQFARESLAPLATPAPDREEAFKRADEHVQQLLRLGETVVDASGLVQDPDPLGLTLAQAVTTNALQLHRMIGRLRDLGGDVLARQALDPLHARVLAGDSYVMYAQLERQFARYERVAKSGAEAAAALAFEDAFKPVNVLLRQVRRGPLVEGGPKGDAQAYTQAAQAALEAMQGLTARSLDRLEGQLQARASAQRLERNLQLGAVALVAVLMAYLVTSFYIVTRDGLNEVRRHIDALAQGDLSTHARPLGNDEAAALVQAIDGMQQRLRALIGEVRDNALAIQHSCAEVSSGALDLSTRTERTAGRLQETSSAMRTLGDAVQRTADSAGDSRSLGLENAEAAGRGGEVIARAVQTMQELQASSRRVGDIVGVIDGIAFQTNILALNAAVEAARAGEQGRGFAVVAGEVRSLAQRSAEAAREIKQLVAASSEQTEGGVRVVGQGGQAIHELVDKAHRIVGVLSDMAADAGVQTQRLAEVRQVVEEIDEDTQRNAALVEQSSAAAAAMKDRADRLVASAAAFRLAEP